MTARRWRLFPKYALLIIALVGGMLLAASAVSLYFSWRETRQHLVALQVEKAEGAATRIEQYVQGIEQQLGWTALPTLDAGGGNPVEGRRIEYLKLLRQVPAITEVAWIDATGHEQLRVSRLAMDTISAGTDVSKEPRFLVAKSGKTWTGPVYFRKETEPYLTIARPAGGAGGVTAAEVNLKFVWEVVSRIHVGKKGLAYVVDDTGTLIAHPDISLVLKKIDMRSLPQVAALGAEAAPEAHDLAGQPVFAAHAPIRTLGWQVFVESPRAEALAPLYASVERLGLLLAAGLLLSMVASFFLARALVRPIRSIQEGAVRLGAGELERRIVVKTGDELEGLAEQFNRMAAALQESYAGLERKVEQRTAELSESLAQQTAISEVLRVISRSTTDVAPVFEAILDSATRLFGTPLSAIFRYDGELVHQVAVRNWTAEAIEDARRFYPGPPSRQMISGRVILSGRLQVEEDTFSDPDYDQTNAHLGRWRRMIGAPLLKDGVPVGAIVLAWPDPGPTPPRQIELLQTFADQAVIAIENVRLLNETREALDKQTAIAEILRVISSSPTDTQPVFEAIVHACQRLFQGRTAVLVRARDGLIEPLAVARDEALDEAAGKVLAHWPLDRGSAIGTCMLDARVLNIADTEAAIPQLPRMRELAVALGYGSGLFVPMVRGGRAEFGIAVLRVARGAFTDPEIALARTFADQAVIAIENVRLFNETREALEQQTAAAEVLKVISQSPTDVQPVFDAIAERAMTLCGAMIGAVARFDGESVHLVAFRGTSPEAAETMRAAYPMPLGRRATLVRAIQERAPVQIPDVLADADYGLKGAASSAGYRANMAVPLLREGQVIGSLGVCREAPGLFPDKLVRLLQTFADQAVIAIENVRLFNETREALEQQTALADILKVISESPTDVQPVFDAIAEHAMALSGANIGGVARLEGDQVQLVAYRGVTAQAAEAMRQAFPMKVGRGAITARAILERRPVQIADVLADPDYALKDATRRAGFRSNMAVPMLREGQVIGSIAVCREEPGPFADKLVRLLQTFADQAVIAIENVRLFNETKEALERQTATSDILRVISESPTDVQPVLDAVAQRSAALCRAEGSRIWLPDGDRLRAMTGYRSADGTQRGRGELLPMRATSTVGRAFVERRVVHIEDIEPLVDTQYPDAREVQRRHGFRTVLAVPMMREGAAIGTIGLLRKQVRPFTPAEIALVQTFADQAVIAIENVRLFNETREALEQQTATAQILQVISGSVADATPVFEAILASCERLFGGLHMAINLVGEDGLIHLVAQHGPAANREDFARSFPVPLSRESGSGSAILERRVMHYPDVEHGADVPPYVRRAASTVGTRSLILAPLLWEGRGIGVISVARSTAGPFSDKEIALLRTFADQAVIAIQNARLFEEIQAKSRELETANKHKSEFLANMSHELRTPLNAIIGFSEVLAEQMFGEVNEKQLEYLRDIHSSGQHLLSLINDILDLSKIEAGRMELELSSFDLGLLLDNSMTLVRERATRHGLMLTLDVGEGVDEWVADARKVKQIVINLLSNAVKFTPPGGRVTLRARRSNGAVEIAVIDTGVGIAPDQQALVFEEFRQASGDYLRKSEGTGLGLSLARRFVELHGGTIRVESAPGRGSTFAFILPERTPEAVGATP